MGGGTKEPSLLDKKDYLGKTYGNLCHAIFVPSDTNSSLSTRYCYVIPLCEILVTSLVKTSLDTFPPPLHKKVQNYIIGKFSSVVHVVCVVHTRCIENFGAKCGFGLTQVNICSLKKNCIMMVIHTNMSS